ncbi:MAG TPA: hypothetical protein VL098_03870 [Flavipsychrobacter sp.]|nr:hypothetical protein [Flavipsychrobacter sp.]
MEALKKERIKDRMLKTASKIWGIPENEIDANYDPLILLLIEACAAELEKINYDIQASQSRLLDHLAELLLPDVTSGARPPSCVMQAIPMEAKNILNEHSKFFCTQRIGNQAKGYNADVHFTPVGKFPIFNARLRNILTGDKLYTVRENGTKEVLFEKTTDDSKNVFEIELAFAVDKSLSSLKGLSLFFDLRNHSEAQSFYKNLDTCKGFIHNQSVALDHGYALSDQFDLDPMSMIAEGGNYTTKINRLVAGIYRSQFLTLAEDIAIQNLVSTTPPINWEQILPKEILQKEFAEPMLYIKIALSKPFPRYVLESLMISTNAFPVVSRKFNSLHYRTNQWINIVPLQLDGAFLDLYDIQSSTGKYNYRITPFNQEFSEGDASIRVTGIAKPNSREVRDMVNSLMQAIRDESAYFSDVSNDIVLNRLREVNQILTRLQDQLSNTNDLRQQYSYVLLKPKSAGESLTIRYWTTHVPHAKQVKAYTLLNSLEHVSVDPRSSYTVTALQGGKEFVSESEKKNNLRQQIASRGKIISIEDIKLLAVQLFGKHLKKVEVHKTVKAGTGSNKGFTRVIEVLVSTHEESRRNQMDEMQYFVQEMEAILSENASPVYPYHVKIV